MATRTGAALLLAVAITLPCAAATVRSGDYDGLLVGVDPGGRVTTYFESSTGRGQFSCVFFGSGRTAGGKTVLETWYLADRKGSDVIAGVLDDVTVDAKPGVRLTLEEEHGGCANVQRFASDPPSFALTEPGAWIAIGVVASAKAYFHDDPSGSSARKAFVVTGNALRIYEQRAGWVRAEYVGTTGKRTQGWLKQSELFPAQLPPAKRAPG